MVIEAIRVDLDMDEGKVSARGEGGEEAVYERAVERVAVEAEHLERARRWGRGCGRSRGEEREQGLLRGGRQP